MTEPKEDGSFETRDIRDFLGPLIGKTILDVTTDDWDEVCAEYPNPEDRESNVYLHLSDGTTAAFRVLGAAGFGYPWENS
jgi:hypothetical protein